MSKNFIVACYLLDSNTLQGWNLHLLSIDDYLDVDVMKDICLKYSIEGIYYRDSLKSIGPVCRKTHSEGLERSIILECDINVDGEIVLLYDRTFSALSPNDLAQFLLSNAKSIRNYAERLMSSYKQKGLI